MHTAFLLAAGLGTRLRPLTLVRPKALLPVCGVPMLDHAMALVQAHGHSSVLVNAHHLWEQVAVWAVRHGAQVQVELPDILGTGGGLRAAMERLDPAAAVVVNADVLSDVDLTALLNACPADGAALALRALPPGESIGAVEADASGTVRRIARVIEGEGGIPGTHFTGVHAISRPALARVPDPEKHGESCIIRSSYKELVAEGHLKAIRHEGLWVDIGSPQTYLAANLDVLSGRLKAPLDPWTRGDRGPEGSWLGPAALVHGRVARTVVGAGATVPHEADLEDCVVWDGVEVPAGTHRRTVFYGRKGPAEVLVIP